MYLSDEDEDNPAVMIRQLSEDLRSHLRSGVAITSVTQCAEELVMNALDAGATCIAVRLDLSCFKLQVVDNGHGMTSEQLDKIGERYATSKCHELEDLNSLQYFGYRGEAIASIRDTAAVLEINSRTSQSNQTYCKLFNKGSPLSVSESAVQRPSMGTTVTVHDLFYSLPVRRKAVNEALEVERIRYRVEGIALIHPSVSFSLRNDVTGHVLLQTRKSSSTLISFTHLFGQAKARSLKEVSGQKDGFNVDGFIGKEGHNNKNLQFVFVNKRLVLKTKIHKMVNHILGRSLVLKKRGLNLDSDLSKSRTSETQTSSPPKQGEKCAMFVLNIQCPLDVYDITFDPAKTLVEFKDWSTLTNTIDEMVMNFLRRENLVPLSDLSSLSPFTTEGEDTAQKRLETTGGGERSDEEKDITSEANPKLEVSHESDINNSSGKDYTGNISTQKSTHCLFSRTVKRPYDLEHMQNEDGSDQCKENHSCRSRSFTEVATTHVIEETPVTSAESNLFSVPLVSSVCNSDTSTETDISQNESHECSSESVSPNQCQTPDSAVVETTINSDESITDSGSESQFTQMKKPVHLVLSNESEDPIPSTLRNPLPKDEDSPSAAQDRFGSNEQRKEKKPLICLPDWPSSSRSLGEQKLQNLRLISGKPSVYPAAKIMSTRLGLTSRGEQSQKSAVQTISERLGLAERRVISDKLQKFKNTSVSCRNNVGDQRTVSCEQVHRVPTEDGNPAITVTNQESDSQAVKSVNAESQKSDSCEPANDQDTEVKIRLSTDENSREIGQYEQVSNGNQLSKPVSGKNSHASKSPTDSDKNPIVPTIADIEFLTSRSEMAGRKRFNPFALSTASKLSKLARKSDSDHQEIAVTNKREFLSTSSMLQTPLSVLREEKEKSSAENSEQQRLGTTETTIPEVTQVSEDGFVECTQGVSESVNGIEHAEHSYQTKIVVPQQCSDSVNNCLLGNMEEHSDHGCISMSPNNVLPFTVYSDIDCMKGVDRVTDMDVSEAESVDSVVMPHIDCFSPVISETEASTSLSSDICTQSFEPILISQGFYPFVRIYEEDCQSGGFSPRNLDETMSCTESVSVHLTMDKDKMESPSERAKENDKNNSLVRPRFSPTVISQTFASSSKSPYQYEDDSNSCDWEQPVKNQIQKPFSYLNPSLCKENVESDNIVFVQFPSKDLPSSYHTESFSLRKLLSRASQEVDKSETSRDENQNCDVSVSGHGMCEQEPSDVIHSCVGVSVDEWNGEDFNQIDENLAREFDSEMLDDNFDNSRMVTVAKEGTSREADSPSTASPDSNCADISGIQSVQTEDRKQNCSSVLDEKPSKNTGGTKPKEEQMYVWSEMKDPKTGERIYVNSVTGHTMFEKQWRECGYSLEDNTDTEVNELEGTARLAPLSISDKEKLYDLLDCHLVTGSSSVQVKWRQPSASTTSQCATSDVSASAVEDIFSSWDNPVLEVPEQTCVSAEVTHTSRAAIQSYQTLYPTKFTKAMLKTVQVLGQVDNKFIACVLNTSGKLQSEDLIVLFDQHAAHERVRLEQLTEDIYVDSVDAAECCIKQSQVSPPKTLTFTQEEVRLLKSFRDEFKRIGVVFTINGSSRDSLNIHSIPACLVEREANEVKRGRDSVVMDIAEALIKEHLEMLRTTGGARQRLPPAIHKVLCSQACHGAVKFGDSLSLTQCQELLDSLSLCDLPFQCAHGRPSIMPLLGLDQLRAKLPPQRVKRPKLWKISRNLPIHQ